MYSIVYIYLINSRLDVTTSVRHHFCTTYSNFIRDFLPKEQASHKVAQCPYQKQAKDSWWKNQLGNVQGETATPQLEKKEN